MPSLMATMGVDSSQFRSDVSSTVAFSKRSGQEISVALGNSADKGIFKISNVLQRDALNPAAAHAAATAVKEIGEAGEHAHIPARALGHALKALGPAAASAGKEILHALHSPVVAALAAVAVILEGVKWGIEKLTPEVDNLNAVSLAPNLEKFKDRLIELKAASLDFFEGFKEGRTALEKLNDEMEHTIRLSKSWTDSDNEKADSQKKRDLAQLDLDKANGDVTAKDYYKRKADIEDRYATEKAAREKASRDTEVTAHFEAADKMEKASKESKARIAKLADAAADAERERDANASRLARAESNIKKVDKQGEERGYRNWRAREMYENIRDLSEERQPELIAAAKKAQDELNAAKRDAVQLEKAANEARKNGMNIMSDNAAKYQADQERLKNDRETRDLEGEKQLKEERKKGRHQDPDLNQLQKIGAFSAVPTYDAQLRSQEASEKHLAGIAAGVTKILQHAESGGMHRDRGVRH